MELIQYWAVIRKRIWLILLLAIVSGMAAGVYTNYFVEKKYEASTELIVNQRADAAALNARLDLQTINSNIELVKTYMEIIKSPRILSIVIQKNPDLKTTVDELSNELSISSVNDTQVISVSAKDLHYSRAANIVNAVAKVFQQEIPSIMQVDNVNILNEADPHDHPGPVSPKPKLNIAISVVLALMVGVGITFLIEYLDDTLKTEDDVAIVLGLSTLTLIPRMKESDRQVKGKSASHKIPNEVDAGPEVKRGERNVAL